MKGTETPTPTRPETDLTVDDALRLRRSRILEAMREPVSGLLDGIPEGWEESLLDALVAELRGGPAGFAERVNSLLKETTQSGATGNPWQPALSALHSELMPCLASDPSMGSRAEDLLQEARVLIGEAVEDTQAQHRLMIERRTQALSGTAEMLSAAFDLESIGKALRECLPRLGSRVPTSWCMTKSRRLVRAWSSPTIRSEPRGPSRGSSMPRSRGPSCQMGCCQSIAPMPWSCSRSSSRTIHSATPSLRWGP